MLDERTKLMRYDIPYGDRKEYFDAPQGSVIFEGKMTNIPAVKDFKGELISALESPIGTLPLKELAKGRKNIVFLVEIYRKLHNNQLV